MHSYTLIQSINLSHNSPSLCLPEQFCCFLFQQILRNQQFIYSFFSRIYDIRIYTDMTLKEKSLPLYRGVVLVKSLNITFSLQGCSYWPGALGIVKICYSNARLQIYLHQPDNQKVRQCSLTIFASLTEMLNISFH